MAWAWEALAEEKRLAPSAGLVLVRMAWRWRDEDAEHGRARGYGVAELMADTGSDRRSVQRALRDLELRGLLISKPSPGRPTRWWLGVIHTPDTGANVTPPTGANMTPPPGQYDAPPTPKGASKCRPQKKRITKDEELTDPADLPAIIGAIRATLRPPSSTLGERCVPPELAADTPPGNTGSRTPRRGPEQTTPTLGEPAGTEGSGRAIPSSPSPEPEPPGLSPPGAPPPDPRATWTEPSGPAMDPSGPSIPDAGGDPCPAVAGW